MGPLISGWMEETWFSWTASMSMTDIRIKGFLTEMCFAEAEPRYQDARVETPSKGYECKHCQDDNQGLR